MAAEVNYLLNPRRSAVEELRIVSGAPSARENLAELGAWLDRYGIGML